jgi:hypothetical protein
MLRPPKVKPQHSGDVPLDGAQALATLRDNTDEAVINRANAILDEICLDRKGRRTADQEPHAAAPERTP